MLSKEFKTLIVGLKGTNSIPWHHNFFDKYIDLNMKNARLYKVQKYIKYKYVKHIYIKYKDTTLS